MVLDMATTTVALGKIELNDRKGLDIPEGWGVDASGKVRPIAHLRRFKIQRQGSAPSDSAGRATDTRYQRLHSHTSNTLATQAQQFSVRCSIYDKVSRREDSEPVWPSGKGLGW